MTAAIDGRELYETVVGKGDADYYLRWFALFDERGGGFYPSWHWAAVVFGPLWAVFRKLHNFLWLYVAVALLSSPAVRLSVEFYFLLVGLAWIGLATYANAFYYRHVRKQIVLAQKRITETDKLISYLERKGGVSAIGPLGLIFGALMIGFFSLATVARDDYAVRSNVTAATEEVIQHVLADVASKEKSSSGRQASASQWLGGYPRSVKSVALGEGPVITITYSGKAWGCRRCTVLEDVSLTLILRAHGDKFVWTCRSRDMPLKYVPKMCRRIESQSGD